MEDKDTHARRCWSMVISRQYPSEFGHRPNGGTWLQLPRQVKGERAGGGGLNEKEAGVERERDGALNKKDTLSEREEGRTGLEGIE
jgi:hypothetical protein